ncbi:MAG: hypothetical protein, partial [Olavius algarvensis Gamma 1 endosymbiont]
LIIKAYQERSSMRGIERTHGVCRQTLSAWLKKIRVSPCSGCETGHPSPPFALRSGDNLYVPRT